MASRRPSIGRILGELQGVDKSRISLTVGSLYNVADGLQTHDK